MFGVRLKWICADLQALRAVQVFPLGRRALARTRKGISEMACCGIV